MKCDKYSGSKQEKLIPNLKSQVILPEVTWCFLGKVAEELGILGCPRVSRQSVHMKRIREVAVKQMRQHSQMCSFE